MFGLDAVSVGIGLILIYLLLSLVCTAAGEVLSNLLNSRAKTLKRGIDQLFADTGFSQLAGDFYSHTLIKSLAEGKAESAGGKSGKAIPSYIPAETFSKTLLDLISKDEPGYELTWERIAAGAERLSADPATKQTLRVLVGRSERDVKKLEKEIQDWFDSSMQRVSAWYKKRTQLVLLLIAAAVAIGTNADTFSLVDSLTNDAALRDALVAQAEQMARQEQPPEADLQANMEQLQTLGVPIGWDTSSLPGDALGWLEKLLGLILTTFALSLGAPFWFDLLKKAVNIRSVGRAPQET